MTSAVAPAGAQRLVPEWTFADRMRKIRRDVLGIEQAEFAQQLDVTRQAYAAWESGRNEPRSILAVAKKVELISGVPAGWVLGIDSPNATTGGPTGRYGCGPHGAAEDVAQVIDLPRRYPHVADGYGSSAPEIAYGAYRAVGLSAGGGNYADAS